MKIVLKIIVAFILLLVVIVPIRFYMMGSESQEMEVASTLNNNSLGTCDKKPNCVSSFQDPGDGHYIAPLNLRATLLLRLDSVFEKLGCTREILDINYWKFECKSSVFGFVDDVELLYKPAPGNLFFRSASRVGYSDLDANRKRIRKIKELLK